MNRFTDPDRAAMARAVAETVATWRGPRNSADATALERVAAHAVGESIDTLHPAERAEVARLARFATHAGYAHGPDQTPAEGLAATVLALADAEDHAARAGWRVVWGDDWTISDHRAEYGDAYADGGPERCESAALVDEAGTVLAALGCIDDADGTYRRIVAAELAAQALADLEVHR